MPSIISRFALFAVAISSLAIQTWASPIAKPEDVEARSNIVKLSPGITPVQHFPLNKWGGFGQLDRFDDFFGVDNFGGRHNNQVVLVQQEQLVCSARQINQVQQQLFIIQEFAKRVITQQVCEVEVQTIVLEQFRRGFDLFREDIGRGNGRFPGFDFEIANKFNQIVDQHGQFRDFDFGFNGRDIGRNVVFPSGLKWDPINSPAAIIRAQEAAKSAFDSSIQFVV